MSSEHRPSSTGPGESAQTKAQEVLDRLRRGIERARGFALCAVVIDDAAAQDRAIEQLREALPGRTVHVVRLTKDTGSILEAVLKQLPGGKAEGPVMVTGWADALLMEDGDGGQFSRLHLSYSQWGSRLFVPVLCWMPEEALYRLFGVGPNFLGEWAGICHFPKTPSADDLAREEIDSVDGTDWGMPVEVSRQRVGELESFLAAHRGSAEPAVQASCVQSLHDLGDHLGLLGRNEESAEAYRQGLTLSRSIHRHASPEAGAMLNKLSARFRELGHRQEALGKAREAADIYRILAEQSPDTFLPKLAASLSRMADSLGDLGRREEAFELAQEAVTISRDSAQQRPDPLLLPLAMSLRSLGNALRQLGRREEAREKAREAVDIYEKLAKKRWNTFLPHLAGGHHAVGTCLSDLGCREEALGEFRGTVRAYRTLAKQRPDVFQPKLALSLNNVLSHDDVPALSRRSGRLTEAREAVAIFRQLAMDRPEVYLPHLATSLSNLAPFLRKDGDRGEAEATAEEAVALFRGLAEQRPEAFLPDLAASLNRLANQLGDLEVDDFPYVGEALEKAHEAARIYRGLAEKCPETFLPKLAACLSNVLRFRLDLGREGQEKALEWAQEAVAIYRTLLGQDPKAFMVELIDALDVLAYVLLDLGRAEEALIPTREAVTIRRTLSERSLEELESGFEHSIGVECAILRSMGRCREALETAEDLIRGLRPRFERLPVAFGELMAALCAEYIHSAREGGIEADEELLGPVRAKLAELGLGDDGK